MGALGKTGGTSTDNEYFSIHDFFNMIPSTHHGIGSTMNTMRKYV